MIMIFAKSAKMQTTFDEMETGSVASTVEKDTGEREKKCEFLRSRSFGGLRGMLSVVGDDNSNCVW